MSVLQVGELDARAVVDVAPFPLLVAEGMLNAAMWPNLDADFPGHNRVGYFPYAERDCGRSVNALVNEMTSPPFADRVGGLLGVVRLSKFPVLVSMCRALDQRHGAIHVDSPSRVASAVLYLNPEWTPDHAGCLRFLESNNDIDAQVAPEVRPLYGTLTAFRPSAKAFHGHLPYEGERRVIHVAWLVDALERETRRGIFSRFSDGLNRALGEGGSRPH